MVDAELRADCARLGIDPDRLIPPALQKAQVDAYELWPEHAMAWEVYLGCTSQWRIAVGFGGAYWEGLDYAGVETVMRMYQVPRNQRPEVFAQLQVLEAEEKAIRNAR